MSVNLYRSHSSVFNYQTVLIITFLHCLQNYKSELILRTNFSDSIIDSLVIGMQYLHVIANDIIIKSAVDNL